MDGLRSVPRRSLLGRSRTLSEHDVCVCLSLKSSDMLFQIYHDDNYIYIYIHTHDNICSFPYEYLRICTDSMSHCMGIYCHRPFEVVYTCVRHTSIQINTPLHSRSCFTSLKHLETKLPTRQHHCHSSQRSLTHVEPGRQGSAAGMAPILGAFTCHPSPNSFQTGLTGQAYVKSGWRLSHPSEKYDNQLG